jgi:transposase
MISAEMKTRIRRLFFAEHWRVGTIAAKLGVHRDTVQRALEVDRFVWRGLRPSALDPFLPFIEKILAQYPTLTATRVFEMLKARCYGGTAGQVRRRIRVGGLRPVAPTEAYLQLMTLPGEQGQVDWGHFGRFQVGRASRPLYAFVVVLSSFGRSTSTSAWIKRWRRS